MSDVAAFLGGLVELEHDELSSVRERHVDGVSAFRRGKTWLAGMGARVLRESLTPTGMNLLYQKMPSLNGLSSLHVWREGIMPVNHGIAASPAVNAL